MTNTRRYDTIVAGIRLHNATQKKGDRTMDKLAMTIEEAAVYTGIGRNTLRQLVKWEKVPVLRIGKKVLIKTDVLNQFLEVNQGVNLRNYDMVSALKTCNRNH